MEVYVNNEKNITAPPSVASDLLRTAHIDLAHLCYVKNTPNNNKALQVNVEGIFDTIYRYDNSMRNVISPVVDKYSGGEVKVKLNQEDAEYIQTSCDKVILWTHVTHSDHILEICNVVDIIRNLGIDDISLVMPYIPYARQDRVVHFGESLASKVFADIINSLDLKNVFVIDPHSYVSSALLNRCVILDEALAMFWRNSYYNFVYQTVPFSEVAVVAPDAGAEKRAHKFVETFFGIQTVILAIKHRTSEGISQYIHDYSPLNDKFVVVVDDICDGGRTFISLGQSIRQNSTPKRLGLIVTHGIFSFNALDPLLKRDENGIPQCFDKVYSMVNFNNRLALTNRYNYTPFITAKDLLLR